MKKITKNTIKYLSVVLALLFFQGSTAYAQNDNKSLIDIDTVLLKMKKAIDPESKLAGLKTQISVSELYMPLQKIKAEIITKYKAPDKFYVETVLEDGKFAIQAYNGKVAWKRSNESEGKVKLTGKEFDSFRFSSELESSKGQWGSLFKKMILDRNKFEVGNYKCYKLTGYPKNKYNIETPVIFYIDDSEYLIRKMELTVYSLAGDIPQVVFVEKYKNIDSVLIPVKTKTDIFGAELFLTVSKCNFNEDIEDSVFNFK